MKTYLSVIGDANDAATWSGIPYHFLKAAREVGLVDVGLRLCAGDTPWAVRRAAWNVRQLLRGRRHGGYQYQPCFLEKLFSPVRQQLADNRVISCFQLLPPSVIADHTIRKCFYIDMTLRQLYDSYGAAIDHRTAAEAMEREGEGYRCAELVITHSHWAATSVVEGYGVRADKVRVAVPGANFDPVIYAGWDREQAGPGEIDPNSPLRLVFVGKYAHRKGLDRLLAAVRQARARGASILLRVIGVGPAGVAPSFRQEPGVEWLGPIDKRTEAKRFLHAIAACHVGCLLSRAEAGGMVLREFHALGLPTISPAVGGSPEHAVRSGSISVPPDAPNEAIADILVRLWNDRPSLQEMQKRAWSARHEALWDATCKRMLEFWPDQRAPESGQSRAQLAQCQTKGH